MAEPNTGLPPGATLVSGTVPDQQASSGGLPPGATLVSGDVPESTPAPGTTGILRQINQVGEAGAEAYGDLGVERGATGLIPGMPLVHAAQDIPGVAKTVWNNLPPVQLADSVKQILPLVDAYEKSRASGASIMDSIHAVNETAKQHTSNLSQVQPIVEAFRANPTRETARALIDVAGVAASMFMGDGGIAPETEAAATAAPAAAESEGWMTKLTNPFRKTPAEIERAATQRPGAAAVRTATGASAETPILSGTQTVADDSLAKVGVAKDAAYKQIDDTVGFDLKAEKQKLSDTEYAIKQPGADKVKLQEEIDASTQQITQANAKLKAAGIDPKVADRLNTSWEANKSFKNDIVKSTASDGTINVKQLLNRSKNSRFNQRYGDRLAQAFGKGDATAGKPIADAYIRGLEAAQKAGVDAVHSQALMKLIASNTAKTLGVTALGGGAGALAAWWLKD
jgi:hypothetical protein